MKKLLPALLLGLAFVLTACPGPTTPQLTVSNVTFTSEIQDSAKKSFICNDDFTTTSVSFQYTGDLASWDVELKGATTGTKSAKQTFNYNDPNPKFTEDKATRTITINYVLSAGTAPLSFGPVSGQQVRPGVQPQAITVVPLPKQIGQTNIVLTIRNSTGTSDFKEFTGIPVMSNCKSVFPGTDLAVFNVRLTSGFNSKSDGTGTSYICDNKITPVEVKFQYRGTLKNWTVQFQGVVSKQLSAAQNIDYGSAFYTEDTATKTITVNYSFFEGTAPLTVKPQAITIVPVPTPQQIGTTQLILTVRNPADNPATDVYGGLPVINNCP